MNILLERPSSRALRTALRKADAALPTRLAALFDDAPEFDGIDTLDERALRDIGFEPLMAERRGPAWRF
jgi:hypothetical protein